MRLDAKAAADRTLLDWTAGAVKADAPGELHLRREDVDFFRKVFAGHDPGTTGERETESNTAWQGLLQRQSDAVGAGGLAALPSYKAGGGEHRRGGRVSESAQDDAEDRGTIYGVDRCAAAGGRRGSGGGRDRAVHGGVAGARATPVFCLGATAAARAANGGWQVIDLTYYTADTYFLSFSLYQLWPWESGTLVWEVDYASAPFRGYLGGVDRVFAGREMTKDSAGAVGTLRKELAAAGKGSDGYQAGCPTDQRLRPRRPDKRPRRRCRAGRGYPNRRW